MALNHSPRNRIGASPFCHVERRGDDRSRHYVVHGESPRFVAEIEAVDVPGEKRRGVIRRVVVPNSWSGDYHRSGKLLGAALAFFETTQTEPEEGGIS